MHVNIQVYIINIHVHKYLHYFIFNFISFSHPKLTIPLARLSLLGVQLTYDLLTLLSEQVHVHVCVTCIMLHVCFRVRRKEAWLLHPHFHRWILMDHTAGGNWFKCCWEVCHLSVY